MSGSPQGVVPPVRGDATRALLLDTAERLFAEQGLEGVSLRSVGKAAGRRDNSAAQYHFGSRAGLVAAIVAERSRPIDARRQQLIEELAGEPTPARLVRLFVQPLAEAVGTPARPTWYLRFLDQVVTQDDQEVAALVDADPVGVRYVHRGLRRALVDLPAGTLRRRLHWMAVLTLRVLADHERATVAGQRRAPTGQVVDDLVVMLVALLEAP